MEIRYKRTYTPARGKRYTVGEITGMLGYAMEIAEPRARLKEGKLAPGEICLMLFALTPDEYALKDSDPKALDALADQLQKHVPGDRLMGWRILDLKGVAIAKAVQPQTGSSIDAGRFSDLLRKKTVQDHAGPIDAQLTAARDLQKRCTDKNAPEALRQEWQAAKKALGEALLGLEKVWAAYDALAEDRWPAVGFDGRIEIFTTAERAERVRSQITNVHAGLEIWSLRMLDAAELKKLLQRCAGDGLELLRIDNGFASAELSIRDFCLVALQDNASMRSMILREIQYGMRFNKLKQIGAPQRNINGALESMLTLRGFAWREIGNGSLWALCGGGKRDNCVILSSKAGGNERLLAAFTDQKRAQQFIRGLPQPTEAVEMKFDELARRSADTDGLLIDCGFNVYRLLKEEYDQVRDLRAKPPVIVRVQPQTENNQAPSVNPAPQMDAGLPNPDDFAQPEVQTPPDTEKNDPQPNPPDPDPRPHKGFFKKLFGK